jgi:hypothetical protein
MKINSQWVGQDHIRFAAGLVREFGDVTSQFGICHGTRRGAEQKWFRETLGGDMSVIGTEISETATQFPDTIQWDFHKVNEDWVGRADFVYSNSWDHSYDPKTAFGTWIDSLHQGGVLLLDWSAGHTPETVSVLDPFGIELVALQKMLDQEFADRGSVVAVRDSPDRSNLPISTVVFRKSV